jgi:hypothetical protein
MERASYEATYGAGAKRREAPAPDPGHVPAQQTRAARSRIVWLDQPLVVGTFRVLGYDPDKTPESWLRDHLGGSTASQGPFPRRSIGEAGKSREA